MRDVFQNNLIAVAWNARKPDRRRIFGTEMALARANNGYFVYQQCIRALSLSPRCCLTICAVQSSIRAERGGEIYDAIYHTDASEPVSALHLHAHPEPVTLFSGGTYLGLEPRCDPCHYTVQHQMSTGGRELYIMTFLQNNSAKDFCRVPVSWLDSMEAIAGARRMDHHPSLSSFAE